MGIIKELEQIVSTHSYKEVDGVVVDVQTANAILTVYRSMSAETKAKYESKGIEHMASFAFKMMS